MSESNLRSPFWKQSFFLAVFSALLAHGAVAQKITKVSATKAGLFNAKVLLEPLVASSQEPGARENLLLAASLDAFQSRKRSDDFSALENWLNENPKSPWRLSVLTNLGLLYYQAG